MKIKNKDILNFAEVTLGDKCLPVKVSFALSVNAAAIDDALKAFNAQKRALLDRYGKKNEAGEFIMLDNGVVEIEDTEGWNKEFEELLEAEAEIAITTIKMRDFAKCDESRFDVLSLAEIAALRIMIEK